MGEPTFISKGEAAKAIREAAFHITDPDSGDYGRTVIHTQRGSFGADWDLDDALSAVSKATRCAWTWHIIGHELAVETPDGVIRFDVKRKADQ